jgi:hypothetical protein
VPAYHHARHYIGWARRVDTRLAEHLAGAGSPLVRAAVSADGAGAAREEHPPQMTGRSLLA